MIPNIKAGLSGCKIELINENTLRKYSSSESYNLRLKNQIEKQKYFQNKKYDTFSTPVVFNFLEDKIYYCDMQYIMSESYDSFFLNISTTQLQRIIKFVNEYFDVVTSNKDVYDSTDIKDILLNKLLSFKNTQHQNIIDSLVDYVKLNTFKGVPKTFCHGDLTLTNILFSSDKLYLIDFLDSYIDSYVIDLVKLKQDLYYQWAPKTQNVESIKIQQVNKHLWNFIEAKFAKEVKSDIFRILDVINWLRIEPYLTEKHHKAILNNIISQIK